MSTPKSEAMNKYSAIVLSFCSLIGFADLMNKNESIQEKVSKIATIGVKPSNMLICILLEIFNEVITIRQSRKDLL